MVALVPGISQRTKVFDIPPAKAAASPLWLNPTTVSQTASPQQEGNLRDHTHVILQKKKKNSRACHVFFHSSTLVYWRLAPCSCPTCSHQLHLPERQSPRIRSKLVRLFHLGTPSHSSPHPSDPTPPAWMSTDASGPDLERGRFWQFNCNGIQHCHAELQDFLHRHQKSSVTLFTSDTHQSWLHPQVWIGDEVVPLKRNLKILGIKLNTYISLSALMSAIESS